MARREQPSSVKKEPPGLVNPDPPPNSLPRSWVWRWLPLLALIALGLAFFALGLHHHLNLEGLRRYGDRLAQWIDANTLLAAVAFVGAYALLIAAVPPSGSLISVAGGFLFGAVVGTGLVVIGATLGATLVFLAVRRSLGELLMRHSGPTLGAALERMRAGFAANEWGYMLTLRLVPLFPFWLVNIAPALLSVRLRTFVLATLFGIIPGSAVFTTFGAGLGHLFASGRPITLADALTPEIVGALVGLAVLSLLPGLHRALKRRPTPSGRP